MAAIAVYLVWITVSAAWATNSSATFSEIGVWAQTVIMFVVVATTLTNRRDVRVVIMAFVVGAVISVTIGLIGYGGPTTAARMAAVGDRLTGGGGDPNYQAAAFVAAMFLAAGLVTGVRGRRAKVSLWLALGFIAVGFIATESRGGLVALVVSGLAALVLLPEQRRQILGAIRLVRWAWSCGRSSARGAEPDHQSKRRDQRPARPVDGGLRIFKQHVASAWD